VGSTEIFCGERSAYLEAMDKHKEKCLLHVASAGWNWEFMFATVKEERRSSPPHHNILLATPASQVIIKLPQP
jgi:hypothetical protein